eukprot:15461248-Alexandrium_andersonii.AAC.1
MCTTICNPLIRDPAIRNPADHYRVACISPGYTTRTAGRLGQAPSARPTPPPEQGRRTTASFARPTIQISEAFGFGAGAS